MKRKKNSLTPSVRFASIQTFTDRRSRTNERRQFKLSPENNQEHIDNNKFASSRLWITSTIILICAIILLAYRGYLDTQSVNYPYPGPKVINSQTYFL